MLEDHPRLRGEHQYYRAKIKRKQGSPPLTRGTLTAPFNQLEPIGITPAYAGNTRISLRYLELYWDHPRLRGEHSFFLLCILNKIGSPPLTRGTLYWQLQRITGLRITPAYAGNTIYHLTYFLLMKDHPRIRGEHSGRR